jgi:transcriptional regulator GlxA family with amidase domain
MPDVQLLDVSGPLDVFAEANVQAGWEAYYPERRGERARRDRSSSGTRIMPDRVIGDRSRESIDTLLVAGCPNAADIRLAPAVRSDAVTC